MRRPELWLGAGLCLAALVGVLGLRLGANGPVVSTVAVGRQPWRVVVDARSGRAFVVNRGDGTVSVLDAATGRVVRTIPVGAEPVAAAVDAVTRRVFVANDGDGTVSVLDARDGAVLNTVPVGTDPQSLAVDERTNRVFVPNRSDSTVSVLDARGGGLVRTVAVGLFPFSIAVDAAANRAFVRCNSGRVVMLDARSGAVLRTIPVSSAPWGQVAVDATTARVFVTNPHDRTVSTLDAHGGRVLYTADVGLEGYHLAIDAAAELVVVAGPARTGGRAALLDARSGRIVRTLSVGYAPWPAVASIPDGAMLIGVSGQTDAMGDASGVGAVQALDARRGLVSRTIPAGIFPVDIAVDGRTGRVFVVNYTARWSDGGAIAVHPRTTWWAAARQWLAARVHLIPRPSEPAPLRDGSVTVLDAARL